MNRKENTLGVGSRLRGWTKQTDRRTNWKTAARRSPKLESDSVVLLTRTSTVFLTSEGSKRSERACSLKRLVSRREWLTLRPGAQIVLPVWKNSSNTQKPRQIYTIWPSPLKNAIS